jgi:hypothetical protein
MSYSSIYANSTDIRFQQRVTAALAQEGASDPGGSVHLAIWPVVTATDIEAAYASALAAGNPDPGGDPSVITDALILAKVQALDPTP